MTILLTEKWCAVCMECTPHERMLDGSWRCTMVDHKEREEWHKERAANERRES